MVYKFNLQPHLSNKATLSYFCWFPQELQRSWSTPMLLPCYQFRSAFHYLSRSTISSAWKKKKLLAITMFEQQDSGKWESWSGAHKCNWSPGIFTQDLINMPLKHSRQMCTQNKDTADNDDQKFQIFYQSVTDKVFVCLGHLPLMWW